MIPVFSKGEIVKCIDSNGVKNYVTKGYIYFVVEYEESAVFKPLVTVMADNGKKERLYSTRFKSVLKP